MIVAGLLMYLKVAGRTASRVGRYGMIIFMTLLAALTCTQLFMATRPQPAQLIPNWILAPLIFAAIPYALDRKRAAAARSPSL